MPPELPLVDHRQFFDVAEHEGRAACQLEPAHTGFLDAFKGAGRTTEKIQLDLFRRPAVRSQGLLLIHPACHAFIEMLADMSNSFEAKAKDVEA
jgi:hypothetical protein